MTVTREWQANRRRKLREQGLCGRCGKQPLPGRAQCEECTLAKRAQRQSRSEQPTPTDQQPPEHLEHIEKLAARAALKLPLFG